jgi:hypothetical protein
VKALKHWLRLVSDLKIYAPGVFTNMGKDKNEAFMGEQVAMVGITRLTSRSFSSATRT